MRWIVFVLSFLPFVGAAQDLYWGETKIVNDALAFGYSRPKIGLTDDGTPVVMWGKSNSTDIFVSRMENGVASEPIQVNPPNVHAFYQSWAGPSMAVKGQKVMITFKSQPDEEGHIYLVQSNDGGKTFGDTVRVITDNWSRFPEVAIDESGNPVINYMKFEEHWMDPQYSVLVSDDGGLSFSEPVAVRGTTEGESCDCCPGHVAVEGDGIYAIYRNNDANIRDMFLGYSFDGGASFDAVRIDLNDWEIPGCPSTGGGAAFTTESMYATWMSGASGVARVNIARIDKSNPENFVSVELSPGYEFNENFPKIAGDDSMMGIVYQDASSGGWDLMFKWAADFDITDLSNLNEKVINEQTIGSQMNVDVLFANGTFHFVWQDQKEKAIMYRAASVHPDGVQEHAADEIVLFPNPVEERLRIVGVQSQDQIGIYDVKGRCLLQGIGSDVDVSTLPTGVYRLGLKRNGKTMGKTFVKE